MRSRGFRAFAICLVLTLLTPISAVSQTLSEDVEERLGVAYDRSDAYDPEADGDNSDIAICSVDARASSIKPLELSEEMRYFCKYESSQNYDQGLSSGDGYHAMGYYQFDNRYGLGNFMKAVYEYNPTKYWALSQIGDWYGWDTNGDGGDVKSVKSPGGDWSMADDLNWSWHQAYAADPTEFSRLQNYWAYHEYYEPAADWLHSSYGINLDDYSDCARGMVWGMCNLFGSGGWRRWANDGGLYDGMTSAQLVCSLANALVAGIENGTYHYTYGTSYVNRYKNELDDCLGYLGAGVASLSSANKNALPDGVYSIRLNSARSVALDVAWGSVEDGANVWAYEFNGSDAQLWQVTNDPEGFVTLTNVGSGKVLDVASALRRNGANVQQWSSNGSDAQKWAAVKQSDGSVVLYSKLGQGLVLDMAAGGTSSQTNADLYAANGTQAQRFYFRSSSKDEALKHKDDLPDGTYTFSSTLSFIKVLDVSAGSSEDGANVQLYVSNNTAAQSWKVSHDSEGYVTLTNVGSDKVLDVVAGNAFSGANVWQYASNGSDAQKWITVKGDDGSYTFRSALDGSYVLDIDGASTADGANLQLWESNNTAAQHFSATSTDSGSLMDAWAKKNEGALADGTYILATSINTDKALDVQWSSEASGANVWLYEKNGTGAQSWCVTHDSKGYVILTNVGSGKVLDVSGGVAENGRNVQQYESNGSIAQKWIAVRSGGGVVFQSALNAGYVLDIAGGSIVNETNVQIYQSNGTAAQTFVL